MATLTDQDPGDSYGGLLTCSSAGNNGLSNILQNIQDGVGTVAPIQLSTLGINFTGFALLPTAAADPGAPLTEGQVYVNTAAHTLKYYSGGQWRTLTGA